MGQCFLSLITSVQTHLCPQISLDHALSFRSSQPWKSFIICLPKVRKVDCERQALQVAPVSRVWTEAELDEQAIRQVET